MTRVRLEVCVDTAAGLRAAIAGGADRAELCSRLDLGGLTPTADLLAMVSDSPIPVRAMIRLRGGDFVLNAPDLDQMASQIEHARNAGCEGVVFGAATAAGSLDTSALRALVGAASDLGKTLHRVVDTLSDPASAILPAEQLGFDTLLTSGGRPSAAEGTETLSAMIEQAQRITIMPGAGVSPVNAAHIAARTGATWVHGSFRGADNQTDATLIRDTRHRLERLGDRIGQ